MRVVSFCNIPWRQKPVEGPFKGRPWFHLLGIKHSTWLGLRPDLRGFWHHISSRKRSHRFGIYSTQNFFSLKLALHASGRTNLLWSHRLKRFTGHCRCCACCVLTMNMCIQIWQVPVLETIEGRLDFCTYIHKKYWILFTEIGKAVSFSRTEERKRTGNWSPNKKQRRCVRVWWGNSFLAWGEILQEGKNV